MLSSADAPAFPLPVQLLRLIASEKVQMMDQSVSARQHMRDQILHGRHLREISLEQQRVQQQRKGMPPSVSQAPWTPQG